MQNYSRHIDKVRCTINSDDSIVGLFPSLRSIAVLFQKRDKAPCWQTELVFAADTRVRNRAGEIFPVLYESRLSFGYFGHRVSHNGTIESIGAHLHTGLVSQQHELNKISL